MAEDTSKVVIIALVTLIILAGGFLLFQKFTSKSVRQPTDQTPIKSVEQNQEVKTSKEDTPSVKVLPKTGGEIYFVSLVALSFIASGWGLSKFPK